MDRILQAQCDKALADLAENGGGTYEQGTLLPKTWTEGFAVGIGGFAMDAQCVNAETLAWALKAVAGEFMTSYVGTWLSEGRVYFDGVRYFAADQFERARQAGIEAGQQAIFDFGTMKEVTL